VSMNVKQLLAHGRAQLVNQSVGRLEAEILLGEVLGVDRAWLYANPERIPVSSNCTQFLDLVERRKTGVPIAYLTGSREFWSLSLKVTTDVLIPRHETELLVETALAFIPERAAWRIADLGTGSGAIALAIASERPLCEIHATDYSEAALEVARENGRAIAPGRIQFHLGSWLDPLEGRFELLVSNPPYIASDDPHLRQGDCHFEPADALSPGRDAMAAIRHIASESPDYLAPGGMLAFEHGYEQGTEARQMLTGLGYKAVGTQMDLEKRERVTSGIRE
jgi:release factor glutamine methyltransferase